MHLRLRRKRQNQIRRYQKMLVSKRSHGKYRNEGELFAEPISEHNVSLMGEMIALQALRTAMTFDFKTVEDLYIGLLKDFHHMNEPGYILSEGYDCAQTAICFLWQFKGKLVSEIYGDTARRKNVTIKHACYNIVDSYIVKYRRKIARTKEIDFSDYKAHPIDPINCFEAKQTDYSKADAILAAMNLTEAELETLNCHLNGMTQSEAALALGITVFGVKYRKLRIRQKYQMYIGT